MLVSPRRGRGRNPHFSEAPAHMGRFFLPTSVAGFMEPKMRKDGCCGTGSSVPFSTKVSEDIFDASRGIRASNVSEDARLISSSNILMWLMVRDCNTQLPPELTNVPI